MGATLKIAVVHSYYSSAQPSGENVVVDEQVAALRSAGHLVELVNRHTDELESGSAYRLRAAGRVATGVGESPSTELAAFAPDVVHLHNTFPNLGTRWLKSWGRRTVTTLHNYRTICAAGTLFRDGHHCRDCLPRPVIPAVRHGCYRDSPAATLPVALAAMPRGGLRNVLKLSARLIVLNDLQAEVLGSLTDTPLEVVPNFVQAASRSAAGDRFVFVGRLAPEKGVAELLASWPDDAVLDVVGDGEALPGLRTRFDGRDNINFLGLLPREALLARLGTYQALVVPSLWPEGLPTVVLEAMARGVPSVVSRQVASGPTLERDGVAVRLTSNSIKPSDLQNALRQVRDSRDAFGRRCVNLHSERFSPTAWLDQMSRLYERVAVEAAGK